MHWNLASTPPEASLQSLITDVMTSPTVVVQVKDYYALGQYTKHLTDLTLDKEQGHWRLVGHNGNWDKHVKGWHSLAPLVEVYRTDNQALLDSKSKTEIEYGEVSPKMIRIGVLHDVSILKSGDLVYSIADGAYNLYRID